MVYIKLNLQFTERPSNQAQTAPGSQ